MKISSQKGMSIISVILIVAILTILGAALSALVVDRLKDEQQVGLIQGAEMIKSNLTGVIAHDGAWRATIDKQSALDCLKADGRICVPNGEELSLFLADGTTTLVSVTNTHQGFDRIGNICHRFNETTGNDDCPFRYSITWECEGGGACAPTKTSALGTVPDKPRIVLKASLLYSPKSRGQGALLNPKFLSFQVVRGAEERDLSSTCHSIGGYFDQGRKHCSIQSTNSGCDPVTQYLAGLDTNGVPICRTKAMVGIYCPQGYGAKGLDSAGRMRCGKF